MLFGILRERKSPPDMRAVLSPAACQQVISQFNKAEIIVEPSPIRVFPDAEYQKAGIPMGSDMEHCDVLLGVKEIPAEALIPHKKYFFFSHTIKKQPHNRQLLKTILEKKIELYDHETITDVEGIRLVAFGYYAGIVGSYNGFRAYGLKHHLFEMPKAQTLANQDALLAELKKLSLPDMKILLTGKGRVGNGARKMLLGMGVKEVGVEAYLSQNFSTAVFCQIDVLEYNKRRDGETRDMQDFFDNPQDYQSDFMRFAKVTDLYMACHFHASGAPKFFTGDDARQADFNISVVADISCDVGGPIATTLRASTIAEPLYGYDPATASETDYMSPAAIAVMAVDNLPAELPRDASEGFGATFVDHVLPAFFNGDADGILARARMTLDGRLTEKYAYLQDFVNGH